MRQACGGAQPDVAGRSQILEVHFKNVPRASDVELEARPAACQSLRRVMKPLGCRRLAMV